MNKMKRRLSLLTLVVVLLAIPTVAVLAKELGMLTISGSGIKGEVTLKDPKAMMNLEQSGFFDQAVLTKPPTDLGEGYTITAHLNLDGKIVPFVQMTYYPTNEGQPGYVHYTGRLNGETLQSVDEWNILSRSADNAFRDLMTANNITIQSALITAPAAEVAPAVSAVEPAAPAVSPASTETPYIILALVATILLLVGAGLIVRRRAENQQSV